MDVGSVEAVILALLLLVPGGVGDLVMRSVTNMPEPRSDFGRVLSAVSWSTAALAICECLWAVLEWGPFGSYLLNRIIEANSLSAVTELAHRYLGYIAVAAILPGLVRWLARRQLVEQVFRGRTLLEPGMDRLFEKYLPPSPNPAWRQPYARVRLDGGLAEGWVKWSLSGDSPEAGIILQAVGTDGAIWIPAGEVKGIEVVDLRYDAKLLQRIMDTTMPP